MMVAEKCSAKMAMDDCLDAEMEDDECEQDFIKSAQESKRKEETKEKKTAPKLNPDLLLAKQNADSGEFSFDQKMLTDMFPAFATLMTSLALDQNAFMTLVAAVWLKKYFNIPKYNVITNKAILFLKRQKNVDYKALEPQIAPQL